MSSKTKWFYYFILLTFPFEIIFFTTTTLSINNLHIFNVFSLVEFVFLSLILIKWIFPSITPWKLIIISLVIFAWWSWNIITFGLRTMSGYILISENIMLFLLSSIFLISMIKNGDVYALNNSKLWIAAGIFIYFTSTIIMYTYTKYIFTEAQNQIGKYYIYFHSFINIFCNIIYAIGFLCQKRKASYNYIY